MSGKKYTFISYSRDASVKAHQISGYLDPLGVEAFLFEKRMKASAPKPAKRINAEIRKCDAVILVLSARSRESAWVSTEIGLAIGMGKPVLVYKTAHNLTVPAHIDLEQVTVLSRLEELDSYFK